MLLEMWSWPDRVWHVYPASDKPSPLGLYTHPICGAEVWWMPQTVTVDKRIMCFRCIVESKARNAD